MPISRLSITNFRSYADAALEPGVGFVVLTGENGAGKTNLLEAVSLLAPGRGLRGAKLAEIARDAGDGSFAVAAQIETEGGPVALGTGTTSQTPDRRQVRINGAPAAATALGEWLSVLWLTPAMDRLFADTPGARRRFLDRLVLTLSPGHARHVSRYEAAMRARNRLLADEAPLDMDWCVALEAQMAAHGAALVAARNDTLATLNAMMAEAPEGPFARGTLALEGWKPTDDLAQELGNGRNRDRAAGRTLSGPHRSDLAVTHLGNGRPATGCSTGEQKALLLSIILAHADLVASRLQRYPILLLDEVAAHLDPSRRAALFARLADSGGQVWMTGTEPALFAELEAHATRLDIRTTEPGNTAMRVIASNA